MFNMARTGGDNPIIFMSEKGPRIKLNDVDGNSNLEILDLEDFPQHRFDSKGNYKKKGTMEKLIS